MAGRSGGWSIARAGLLSYLLPASIPSCCCFKKIRQYNIYNVLHPKFPLCIHTTHEREGVLCNICLWSRVARATLATSRVWKGKVARSRVKIPEDLRVEPGESRDLNGAQLLSQAFAQSQERDAACMADVQAFLIRQKRSTPG